MLRRRNVSDRVTASRLRKGETELLSWAEVARVAMAAGRLGLSVSGGSDSCWHSVSKPSFARVASVFSCTAGPPPGRIEATEVGEKVTSPGRVALRRLPGVDDLCVCLLVVGPALSLMPGWTFATENVTNGC